MRYSRVLTGLALIGVVGLTATLVLPGGGPAPKPVRAAVTTPTPRSALIQQLQQLQPLLAAHPLGQHAPTVTLPSGGGTTCPVASGGCSTNPCVVFAQGGSQPVVAESVVAAAVPPSGLTVPILPGGSRTGRCTRHALPRTFQVTSQLALPAQAQSLSVSAPQPSSRHGS